MRLDFATLSSPLQKAGGQGGTCGTTNAHEGLSRPTMLTDRWDAVGHAPNHGPKNHGNGGNLSHLSHLDQNDVGHKKPSVYRHVPLVPPVPPISESNSTANPDRYCWPHSSAMNTAEIDTFTARVDLFMRRGLDESEAERLADGLVLRDRKGGERRLCLECAHLRPGGALWQCKQWPRAGIAGAGVTEEAAKLMRRCVAFKGL